jgi:hypothetical protein
MASQEEFSSMKLVINVNKIQHRYSGVGRCNKQCASIKGYFSLHVNNTDTMVT